MAELRCALAILPAEGGDPERLLRSLQAARAAGIGDFAQVAVFTAAAESASAVAREAADAARAAGSDWLLLASAVEILAPDIFVKIAPALRIHDAVWGGAGIAGSASTKPETVTRLAAQDLPGFFHAALAWWIGQSHFVRPQAALAALGSAEGEGWYADYLVHLWRNCRAYKTAQQLTVFQHAIPAVPSAARARLIEVLGESPVFMPVRHGPHTLRLPYTGVNPVIEREQMRGLPFEHEELTYLQGRLPHGMCIVDAGANTGNHTLFFAAVMEAEAVIPIEPHPRAAAAIRAAVAENGTGNVDLSLLGIALGREEGRLRAIYSADGGLGATRFLPDPEGDTPVLPLDALAGRFGTRPVDFIKIDVEGMEMAVLRGAVALIARDRPYLFIEILDENISAFMNWVDANGYEIEKLFPDKTHCNYFLAPGDKAFTARRIE